MDDRILVTRSSMPSMEEYIREIEELWESRWLTNMGVKHNTFQNNLKDYLGMENVVLLTNGHMALELTIQAMNLRKCEDAEVITTPFTFASTTHAIVRNGLKPVFCDINSEDYTLDVNRIEELITDKTVAILPVHVYGNVCNIEAIERIARKHNLKVIYDAAHTFGEKYDGRSLGCYGDASVFSFHATKVFHTIEGGAVCFKEKTLGDEICNLKNFGIQDEDSVVRVGANAKMNEFCAAMGICNLRHIDEEIRKRKKVSEQYDLLLGAVPGIQIRKKQDKVESNYAYYPIIVDEKIYGYSRNELHEELLAENIGTRKYFYPLTNEFECFNGRYDIGNTPIAKYISRRVLALPMFADLSEADVDRICQIIKK